MRCCQRLFAELSSKSLSPDVTTSRTLIDAYSKVGRIDDCLKTFNRMVEARYGWLLVTATGCLVN